MRTSLTRILQLRQSFPLRPRGLTALQSGHIALTLLERAAISITGASAVSLISATLTLLLSPFRAYQACMGKFLQTWCALKRAAVDLCVLPSSCASCGGLTWESGRHISNSHGPRNCCDTVHAGKGHIRCHQSSASCQSTSSGQMGNFGLHGRLFHRHVVPIFGGIFWGNGSRAKNLCNACFIILPIHASILGHVRWDECCIGWHESQGRPCKIQARRCAAHEGDLHDLGPVKFAPIRVCSSTLACCGLHGGTLRVSSLPRHVGFRIPPAIP